MNACQRLFHNSQVNDKTRLMMLTYCYVGSSETVATVISFNEMAWLTVTHWNTHTRTSKTQYTRNSFGFCLLTTALKIDTIFLRIRAISKCDIPLGFFSHSMQIFIFLSPDFTLCMKIFINIVSCLWSVSLLTDCLMPAWWCECLFFTLNPKKW